MPQPRPVVVDSSILIPFFRAGTYDRTIRRLTDRGRLVLSSVVAEELVEGATDQRRRQELRLWFHLMQQRGTVATPTHDDWIKSGELIVRYSMLRGAIDGDKHQNDILIVLTARRLGAEVLTNDAASMVNWARMLDAHPRMVPVRIPEHEEFA